jgi:GTP-binding protein
VTTPIASTSLPRFIKSAAKLSQCPDDIAREVALIGRSKVGKSTLLNALLGQNLVRKSRTPGRTQLINYFESKHHDIFVDLPGYGERERTPRPIFEPMKSTHEGAEKTVTEIAVVVLLHLGRPPA